MQVLVQLLVAPSEESANAMTQLGVEFGKGALQAKGLSGVLSDIIDASGGSTAVMELLLGSQGKSKYCIPL